MLDTLTSARRAACTLLIALAALAAGAALPAVAGADNPFAFSAPVVIDTQAPYGNADTFTGVACPTTSLCVAVNRNYSDPGDSQGDNIETSTDPTDATPTWSALSASIADVDGVACTQSAQNACVAVGSGGYLSVTTAAGSASPHWTVAHVDAADQLTAAACAATTSLCVAVDDSGRALTTANLSASPAVWSAPADIDATHTLTAISCPSTALCAAVDDSGQAVFSTNPASATPTWSRPASIDPGHVMLAISCPTAALCVAVDDSGQALVGTGFASSPSWSAATDVDPISALSGISCPSTATCFAVDEAGNELVATNLATLPSWSQPRQVREGAPLAAVSCANQTMCVAVDYFSDALNSTNPAAGAPTWGFVATEASSNALLSVACPAAGSCVATDDAGRVLASTDATAATPTWTSVQADDWEALTSVSCPSSTLCVAVDDFGEALISTDPFAANPSWSTPDRVDGSEWITTVSCPTSSLCVAVDDYGHELIATISGGSAHWSGPVDIDGDHTVTGLSCPSTSLCEAVDDSGQTLATSTPSMLGGWTTTSFAGAGGGPLVGVSCPSSLLCVVAGVNDALGASRTPLSGGWASLLTGATYAYAVACSPTSPASVCLKLGEEYSSLWLDSASTSSAVIFGDPDPPGYPTADACPATSTCEIVDDRGAAFTASDHTVSVTLSDAPGAAGVVSVDTSAGCTSSCSANFAPGRTMLQAGPEPGSSFAGWGGACSGSSMYCTLDLTADTSVTATFVTTATVQTCTANCGSSPINVQTPNGVYVKGPGTTSTPAPTTKTNVLKIAYAGGGRGVVSDSAGQSCSAACSLTLALGQALTLTAKPQAGSRFTGWNGACSTASGACNLLLAADTSVTATFAVLAPDTQITSLRVLSSSARAKLAASGTSTQIQCALVRKRSGAHPKAAVVYRRCGAAKNFNHLLRGRYTLYARAVGPGGHDPTPATRSFTIS